MPVLDQQVAVTTALDGEYGTVTDKESLSTLRSRSCSWRLGTVWPTSTLDSSASPRSQADTSEVGNLDSGAIRVKIRYRSFSWLAFNGPEGQGLLNMPRSEPECRRERR